MKRLLFLLLLIPVFSFSQHTAIPDQNFEQALIDLGYDNVIDGQVLTAIINTVTVLVVNNKNISDLTGIEDFTALTYLSCGGNQLTTLDLSQNTALTGLGCGQNQLTSLDVSQNTALTELTCYLNQLTSIDVSQNTALTELNCNNNQLTSIDVSQNTALTELYCNNNQLSAINVSNLNALEELQFENNNLSSLDLSNNHLLTDIFCNDNNLSNINLSNNTNLEFLYCERNPITELYLGDNHNLSQLSARGCSLECLNLRSSNSTPINLYRLWLGQNSFQTDNPNLNCIEVDDTSYYNLQATNPNGSTNFEYTGSFSNNCNNSCSPLNIEYHIYKTSIYPNPTNNLIKIEIENYNGSFEAELYDFNGKLLETTNSTKLSLVDYPKGIYLLKVSYGDRVEEIKVVKE